MSLDATVIGPYVVKNVEAKLGDMAVATGDGVAGSRGATGVKSPGVEKTTSSSYYED